jgi:hypothetical protein
MVEVLGNFAIVTKEMKQGRASESIPANTLPVADKNSEKCFKKLVGRRWIDVECDSLDHGADITIPHSDQHICLWQRQIMCWSK